MLEKLKQKRCMKTPAHILSSGQGAQQLTRIPALVTWSGQVPGTRFI